MKKRSLLLSLLFAVLIFLTMSAQSFALNNSHGTIIFKCYPVPSTVAPFEQRLISIYYGPLGLYFNNRGNCIFFQRPLASSEDAVDTIVPISLNGRATYIALSYDDSIGKVLLVYQDQKWAYEDDKGSYAQCDADRDEQPDIGFVGASEAGPAWGFYEPTKGPLTIIAQYTNYKTLEQLQAIILGQGGGTDEPPPETVGEIKGVIIDSSTNEGVSGATITTTPGGYTDTSSAALPFTTITVGEFKIGNVPGATYTLTISKTGYTTKTVSSVVVVNGQTKDLGNVTLVPTGGTEPPPPPPPPPEEKDPTISGRILDGGSSSGLAGVKIEANGETQGYTDEEGNFSIVFDEVGNYRLFFSKKGYHELATDLIELTTEEPVNEIGDLRMTTPNQEAYLYFASSAQTTLANSWWSNVILLNPNNTSIACSIEAYGDEPLTFTESISSLSKRDLTGIYDYLSLKSGAKWDRDNGWLRIKTGDTYEVLAHQVMGSSRFKYLSSMGSARLARHHLIPLVSLASDWWIGLSMLNPSNSQCNVSIKTMALANASSQYYAVNSVNLTLQSKEVKTDDLESIIGALDSNANDSWLEITSDLPIAFFSISGNNIQAIGITSQGK